MLLTDCEGGQSQVARLSIYSTFDSPISRCVPPPSSPKADSRTIVLYSTLAFPNRGFEESLCEGRSALGGGNRTVTRGA